MKIVQTISWVAAVVVASSLAIIMPAFAQTSPTVTGGYGGGMRHSGGIPPGVFGTVSAINGDSLTVTARAWPQATSTSPTVYAVDATNAQIYKGGSTSTVSLAAIAVGDTVVVQGTVSGTNVAATVIRDGVVPMMGRPGMGGGKGFGHGASSTSSGTMAIQGNGEPVIGGSVTNVNGTTLTVTNPSNVTYTIDAASTTIIKDGTSTAITNIAVGDNVIVQGTVNGTSVTASSIIDQGVRDINSSSTNGSSTKPKTSGGFGFGNIFGAIGGFFQHLFGF